MTIRRTIIHSEFVSSVFRKVATTHNSIAYCIFSVSFDTNAQTDFVVSFMFAIAVAAIV